VSDGSVRGLEVVIFGAAAGAGTGWTVNPSFEGVGSTGAPLWFAAALPVASATARAGPHRAHRERSRVVDGFVPGSVMGPHRG
jgi:hypothetical protein